MSSSPDLNALILIYPSFNTLDMAGPLDVICCSAITDSKRIRTTLAAAAEHTQSFEGLSLRRDLSFSDLLADTSPSGGLAAYDLLLVPGGDGKALEAAMAGSEIVEAIREYVRFGTEKAKGERWVMSVCTGAVFLGAAGVLRGKTVTTHFHYLEYLREICGKVGGEGTEVVRKRYVDAGRTEEGGLRLLTAGGVICGIDAALWFVKEKFGKEEAKRCAQVMDYGWQLAEVGATVGYLAQ